MPFDAPAGFSRWGKDEPSYGQQLASKFQLEMQKTGELGLVELFNVDNWPGKREEFFTGNFRALELARKAGYEMILVGSLQIPRGESTMVLYTKLIDVQNGVTAWSAQTTLTSSERDINTRMAQLGFGKNKPDEFGFPRRTDAIVQCTVPQMLKSAEQKIRESEEAKKATPSPAVEE